jgi:metal-sulfur cluster biosynthetic enzyme
MSETAAQLPDEELLADIEEAMRDVVDPELGINVVDLGLVYWSLRCAGLRWCRRTRTSPYPR